MKPRQSGIPALVALLALAAMGCNEIPQDARKPFAGADETRGFVGAHEERARTQDEYPIMRGARVRSAGGNSVVPAPRLQQAQSPR